ncbi:MAG: hypothetical protein N3D75_02420 [Candidatus Aenigmarchaeota archaeon]|nr:hypothetical protein [Candidatus Aenigmarchaeota archaeon]
MTVETRTITGFRVAPQSNQQVDFSPSNPKNYGILEEVDVLENEIPELKGEELKVATMRLLKSILSYTRKLFPEAEEVVQNWGNFIIPYLYGDKTTCIKLENQKSLKLILHGYPTTIYYSENVVIRDGWHMTDFVVTGFDLEKLFIYNNEQIEQTPPKLSPLILSRRPADIRFLEWFANNLVLEIKFEYEESSSKNQTQCIVQGLFAFYELPEIARKIPGRFMNDFVNHVYETLEKTRKTSGNYETLRNFVGNIDNSEIGLLQRLCICTWPLTVKIVQMHYLDILRELNYYSNKKLVLSLKGYF